MSSITPRYSLPYPLSTDPANPPNDFNALATTVDNVITGYVTAASTSAPSSVQGTIWYQTDSGYVLYKNSAGWTNISNNVIRATSAPTAYSTYTTGQMWLNTSTNALSVYSGSAWQIVSNFPATMGSAGTILTSSGVGSTPTWSAPTVSNAAWQVIDGSTYTLSGPSSNSSTTTASSGVSGFKTYQINFSMISNSAASQNGQSVTVSYAVSGASITNSTGASRQIGYTAGSSSPQIYPSYVDMRILTVDGTGSITITPTINAAGSSQYVTLGNLRWTIIGISN
jgi:hypothetical protein